MSYLVDSNVWLPLVWNGHSHHRKAIAWVAAQRDSLCFCRVTHLALLLRLTHKAILGDDAVANSQAFSLVAQLLDSPSIRLIPEPTGTQERLLVYGNRNTKSPQLWADDYLAAFALAGGLRFATFDKGFNKYEGLDLELL